MFDVELIWDLTKQETDSICSKIEATNEHYSQAGELIFQSSTLSIINEGVHTKWYLEIIRGMDHFLQLNLCLADINKFSKLNVTYQLSFMVINAKTTIEVFKNFFKEKKKIDPKINYKCSFPDKFLNVLYSVALAPYLTFFKLNFICIMQIELIEKSDIFQCIQTDYEKLLNDTKTSDFILVTPTKKFKVHKIILAARSDVFAAMFEDDMKEKNAGFVEIEEFDDEVVQEFLRYIYCGKVKNLSNMVEQLLNAAEKYLISDLKAVCLEEYCKNLSTTNAVEILSLVDKHNVEHVTFEVIEFIVNNVKAIDKSNLQRITNAKILNEILRRIIDLKL